MHLALQLLGGLRRRGGNSVFGRGELVVTPADFKGDPNVNGTGIVIDGLEFSQEPDGQMAPFAFIVTPQIRVTGTRRLMSGAINPLIRCHIVYDLTLRDGTRIASDEVLINPLSGETDDEYLGFGSNNQFNLLDSDLYRLTVTAYLTTSTVGISRKAEYIYDFEIARNEGERIYYDDTDGNSANDGKDPVGHMINGGSGLTAATYTESTGIVREVGAFTDLVLTNEAKCLESNRHIWIDGFGSRDIAEKISADEIRLRDHHKLGSDQTGLTSSTGPKKAADFATEIILNSANLNKCLFLSAINDDVYTRTIPYKNGGGTGNSGLFSYGGYAKIGCAEKDIIKLTSGATAQYPNQSWVWNLELLCNDGEKNGVAGTYASSRTGEPKRAVITKVNIVNPASNSAIGLQDAGDAKTVFLDFGSTIYHGRTNIETFSPAGALTAGDGTIQVSTTIPSNVNQESLIIIEEGGVTEYCVSDSWSGDTFTLGYYRQDNKTNLVNNFTAAATVTVSKTNASAIFCSFDQQGVKNPTIAAQVDQQTYDHIYYVSTHESNNYLGYVKAEVIPGTPPKERPGYCFNLNATGDIDNVNIQYPSVEPDACEYLLDSSTGSNITTEGVFTSVYAYGLHGAPAKGIYFAYTPVEVFGREWQVWSATPKNIPWFIVGEGGTDALWPNYDWDWSFYNVKAYGYLAAGTDNGLSIPNKFLQNKLEITNCKTWYTGTGNALELGKTLAYADDGRLVFSGNNVYAPNAAGNSLELDRTNLSLEDFNTAVDGVNTSNNPGWFDPANGDFSIKYNLTLGQPNRYAKITGFNTTATNPVGTGAFKLEIEFSLSSISYQELIANDSINNYIRVNNASTIEIRFGTDIRTYTIPDDVTLSTDTFYKLTIQRVVGGDTTIKINNGTTSASQSITSPMILNTINKANGNIDVDKIVRNIKLTHGIYQLNYNIDGGQVPESPATSVVVPADVNTNLVDSNTITYYNITSSNWTAR